MKILQLVHTAILIFLPILVALTPISVINLYLIESFGLKTFMVFFPFIALVSAVLFVIVHVTVSAIEFRLIHNQFQGKIKWSKRARQVFYHSYDHDEVRTYFNSMIVYRMAYKSTQFILPSMWVPSIILKLFGMRIGKGVMMVGVITDPGLVEIGDSTIIGLDSAIASHILQKGELTLKKVKIGRNCVIGGRAIIMPGVEIGDNSIVGTASLVTEGTKIPPNTIWAGVPAKQIRKRK